MNAKERLMKKMAAVSKAARDKSVVEVGNRLRDFYNDLLDVYDEANDLYKELNDVAPSHADRFNFYVVNHIDNLLNSADYDFDRTIDEFINNKYDE